MSFCHARAMTILSSPHIIYFQMRQQPLIHLLFLAAHVEQTRGLNLVTMESFRNRLPDSHLGISHADERSFFEAASKCDYCPIKAKEFTSVVVTASPRHILLGMKNRGFGKGLWNSFGGKLEAKESPENGASRELLEEANIQILPSKMMKSKVGVLRYTFEEDPVEMVMHLYHIHMPSKDCNALADVRGCEEITPQWFDDWHDTPLHKMFADDSHWLCTILANIGRKLEINGRFHFRKNCQETNTILHHFVDVTDHTNTVDTKDVSSYTNSEFRYRLPLSRLGTRHATVEEFYHVAYKDGYRPSKSNEYTLVLVTASPMHILLGLKNRGFGKGMHNSFGGKIEMGESSDDGASRELREETNIDVPSEEIRQLKVGVLRFTEEDDPLEMIVHLYRVHMPNKDCSLYAAMQGCEEITPKWFSDWRQIPLNNMFADDSVWIVPLLSSPPGSLQINGRFHFKRNLTETNSIVHHFIEVTANPKAA